MSNSGALACRRTAFVVQLAALAFLVFPFAEASATEADSLEGFASVGLNCPRTETGMAQAMMSNSQGERRVVQTTYQGGIATLVALLNQAKNEKDTLLIALDPKTDPNTLARRLAALTRGCFLEEEPAVTVPKKRPRVPAVHRRSPPPGDNYAAWPSEDHYGGCGDFLCALFGNHGR